MTKSATFQTKQNTSVVIGTEVTMGTATLAAGVTLEVPITDFSFSEIKKHSLSVAPPRVGSGAFTQSDDMVKWQRHDRMFDVSITFHGTAQAINRVCGALFGDDDGTNTLILQLALWIFFDCCNHHSWPPQQRIFFYDQKLTVKTH